MAVQFGTVTSGTTASSAFTLSATERALVIAVSSIATNVYWASFQITPGGPFVRFIDPWTTNSGAFFAGANGGIGVVEFCASQVMRVEANASVSGTCSFALIEVTR